MTYQQAIQMGGKEWQGKRVYFSTPDQKAAIYGVEIVGKDGFKDGEKISRSNLYKITSSSPYFDIAAGELCGLVKKLAACSSFAKV